MAGLRNRQFVIQAAHASLGECDFRSEMKSVTRLCSKELEQMFRWMPHKNGSSLFPMPACC